MKDDQDKVDTAEMPVPAQSGYRCQFCGEYSPVKQWEALNDKCPKCGREYDPITLTDYDS